MSDATLWYITRAAGLVSLLFLSGVVVLGLLARLRFERPAWPRFLTTSLHRNLSLLALVFLGLHIVIAVVDPYTHLGLAAATVPFGSYYRTLWLGLGTIAFELLLAIVVTGLLRRVIGVRIWRAVHWLAYAAWPFAVLHGLGTGTDAFSLAGIAVTGVAAAAVGFAAVYRLRAAPTDPPAPVRRVAGGVHVEGVA